MRKIILFSLLFSLTIAPQQKVEAKLPGWLTHPATMVVEAALIAAGITLSVVCKKKIIDQYKEKIDFLNDLSEHLQIDGPNSLTIENLESSQAIAFAKQKNQSEFLKEIMLTPEFESFLVDTIKSTSYQDISGILNLFIISRLVNSKFFAQLLGLGDASIQKIFSRQDSAVNRFFDSRIDGDYAQLISINSEYGVIPYLDSNYSGSTTVGEVIGIWFDSEEELRREMGPGEITIGSVTSQFNYVSSQEVPFYGWQTEDTNLFGTELNKWRTDEFITAKYQDEIFDGSLTDYPYTDLGNGYGYLYNQDNINVELDEKANTNSNHPDYYRVGSPFHFYFGLKQGKSALNRFIKKFVLIQD